MNRGSEAGANPSRCASTPRLLLTLGVLLGTACRGQDAGPSRPPGLVDSEGNPLVSSKPPEPTARPPQVAEPTSYDFERPPAPGNAVQNPNLGQPTAVGDSEPADAAVRDLSAELSAALERTTQCVDLAQAASQPGGRLVVTVSAFVLGSGRISRAIIGAPGQPPAAVSCVEREVLAIKLRDPVQGAPVNVKGSTEVLVKAAKPASATAPAAVPPVQRRGATLEQSDEVARPDPTEQAGPP